MKLVFNLFVFLFLVSALFCATENASASQLDQSSISKEQLGELNEALKRLEQDEVEYGNNDLGIVAALTAVATCYVNMSDARCLDYIQRKRLIIEEEIKKRGAQKIGNLKDNRQWLMGPLIAEIYYYNNTKNIQSVRERANQLLTLAVEINKNGQFVGAEIEIVAEMAFQCGDEQLLQTCIQTLKEVLTTGMLSSEERAYLVETLPLLEEGASKVEMVAELRGKRASEIAAAIKSDESQEDIDSSVMAYEKDPSLMPESVREGIRVRQKQERRESVNANYMQMALDQADQDMNSLLKVAKNYIDLQQFAKAEGMFPLIDKLVNAYPTSALSVELAQESMQMQVNYYLAIGNVEKADQALKNSDEIIRKSHELQSKDDAAYTAVIVTALQARVAAAKNDKGALRKIADNLLAQSGRAGADAPIDESYQKVMLGLCFLQADEQSAALELLREAYPRTLALAQEARDKTYEPDSANANSLGSFLQEYQNAMQAYLACSVGLLVASHGLGDMDTAFRSEQELTNFLRSLNLPVDVINNDSQLLRLFAINDLAKNNKPAAREKLEKILQLDSERLSGALALPQQDLLSWQQQYYDLSLPASLLGPDDLFELVLRRKGIASEVLLQRSKLSARAEAKGDTLSSDDFKLLQAGIAEEMRKPVAQRNSKRLEDLEKKARAIERKLAANANVSLVAEADKDATVDSILKTLGSDECLVDFISVKPITSDPKAPPAYEALIVGVPAGDTSILSQGIQLLAGALAPEAGAYGVLRIKIGEVEAIDGLINSYRAAIAGGDTAKIEDFGKILYESIWKPIEDALPDNVKRVFVSPEQAISFVPFSALNSPTGRFVAEDYSITYVGSARDLLLPQSPKPSKLLSVFANPKFDTPSTSLTESSVMTGHVDLFGQIQLPPLPGTEAESEALKAVASSAGWKVETFVGREATENQVRSLKAPSILHLATHGFYLNTYKPTLVGDRGMSVVEAPLQEGKSRAGVDPMLASGVALTGAQQTLQAWSEGKSADTENDGVLTAQEVANLDLEKTWLVTLSACETGVGEAKSGEGVFGLRRAFKLAGADYLLMTLWPVSDEATAKLMADFYKEALVSGDAPGSLAKVQRDWLVKIRAEKGMAAAVRDAGPFAVVMMSNPRLKSDMQPVANTQAHDPVVQTLHTETPGQASPGVKSHPNLLTFDTALAKADGGDAYAQAIVSIYYGLGYHTAKDIAKSAEYALKSASAGHPLGIYRVGVMRENGEGMAKDEEQSRTLKLKAFDGLNEMTNDPYALTALGVMVFKGDVAQQDRKEAARLYRIAADAGYAPAQYNYAACLFKGHGVEIDEQKALRYWEESLAQNYPPALKGPPR